MKVNWRHWCVLLVIFCWVGCDEESESPATTSGTESATESPEEGEESAEEGEESAEEGEESAEEGEESGEEGEGSAEEGEESAEEGAESGEEGEESAEEGAESAEEGAESGEEGEESTEEEVCVSDKVEGDDFTPLFQAICDWEFNCETELNGDPKWETMEDCMAEGSGLGQLSADMFQCKGAKFQDMIDCYEDITVNSCGEKYVDLDCFALVNQAKKNCDYPDNYCGDDLFDYYSTVCGASSDDEGGCDQSGSEAHNTCMNSFYGYTGTDTCKGPGYDAVMECMQGGIDEGCAEGSMNWGKCLAEYTDTPSVVPCNPEEEEETESVD